MDPGLPPDDDDEAVDPSPRRPRPVHLSFRYLGLVWVGGTAGTAARYLVTEVVPPAYRVPVAILAVNLVGAFVLGLLLEVPIRAQGPSTSSGSGGGPSTSSGSGGGPSTGSGSRGGPSTGSGSGGDDSGRPRVLRLLLGTGFLGGFTTYSALAVDTVTLLRGGLTLHAVGYATATLLGGALVSWAGIVAAGALRRRPRATLGPT